MDNSIRRMLAESHSGAVAVTLLIVWALRDLLYALQAPAEHLLPYIGTAIAILDVPAPPSTLEIRMVLLRSTRFLVVSLTEFGIAWFLSRLVYRNGPLTVLRTIRNELKVLRK